MSNEFKRAAQAVLNAQDAREASWDGKQYQKTATECYLVEYDKANISEALQSLLCLADNWWNDIQDWANNILNEDSA